LSLLCRKNNTSLLLYTLERKCIVASEYYKWYLLVAYSKLHPCHTYILDHTFLPYVATATTFFALFCRAMIMLSADSFKLVINGCSEGMV